MQSGVCWFSEKRKRRESFKKWIYLGAERDLKSCFLKGVNNGV